MNSKRAFDVSFALLFTIVLIPLLVALSLLVLLFDGWPIFFKQERVGLHGKRFNLYKFRTMRQGKGGLQITASNDSRITPLGSILRKTKLDELPQLFNVLFGQMSIVGPRPEVPYYIEKLNPEQRNIVNIKPGITDPSSIEYRAEEVMLANSADPEKLYLEEILPRKIELSLTYSKSATFLSDIRIIVLTVFSLFHILK